MFCLWYEQLSPLCNWCVGASVLRLSGNSSRGPLVLIHFWSLHSSLSVHNNTRAQETQETTAQTRKKTGQQEKGYQWRFLRRRLRDDRGCCEESSPGPVSAASAAGVGDGGAACRGDRDVVAGDKDGPSWRGKETVSFRGLALGELVTTEIGELVLLPRCDTVGNQNKQGHDAHS